MARLSALKSRVRSLPSTLAFAPQGERERDRHRANLPWRKWYTSTRWRTLRLAVFVRDKFTCQRCGRLEGNTSRLVANHKIPHRGDEALFWDEGNIETACKPCHDSIIQREEKSGALR